MSVPLDVLIERLKQYDEVQICELLELTAEDLVLAFVSKIRERREFLSTELEIFDDSEELLDEEPTDENWE